MRIKTLGQFIIEKQADFPYSKGELFRLLRDLGIAAKIVHREVNKAGLADILGMTGEINIQGEQVKKGDEIGTLYIDPVAEAGKLVHLHLGLVSGWGTRGTSIMGGEINIRTDDPKLINPNIYSISAEPQGNKNFHIPSLPDSKIEIAHFKSIRINE